MTYLVTGGAGFIGSHVVDALIERGDRVRVFDNLATGVRANVHRDAEFVAGDVRDAAAVAAAGRGVDGIFHFAALPSVPLSIEQPQESHDVNATGTLNVLVAARDAGVRRVILASSSAIYGDADRLPVSEDAPLRPKSPYALHKLIGESYARLAHELWNLESVCLRFFNVYGPRMSPTSGYAGVVAVFLRQRQQGEPLTVAGDGSQTRDFVYVADVAQACLAAMERSTVGAAEPLNIGMGTGTSVRQLADLIGGPCVAMPPRVEIKDSLADVRRAHRLLDWTAATPFKDGIERTRAWLRSEPRSSTLS